MQRAVLVVAAALALVGCRMGEPTTEALAAEGEERGDPRADAPGWRWRGETVRRGKVDALAPATQVGPSGSLRALGDADWPGPEPEAMYVERGPAEGTVPLALAGTPEEKAAPPPGAPVTGAQPGAVQQDAQPVEPQQRGDKGGDVPSRGGK